MAPSKKEEVNAWGSYDQVAKSARALPIRRRSSFAVGDARRLARSQNERSGTHNSFPSSSWRPTSFPDVEVGRSKRSGYDFALSSLRRVDKKGLLLEPAEETHEDSEGEDPLGEQPRIKEPKEPYQKPKVLGPDLSEDVKTKIRDIFCVFFEGCHHVGDEAEKNDRRKLVTLFNGTMPWLRDSIEQQVHFGPLQSVLIFIQRCLRGVSQVYFQNNPLSGMLIVAGLLVQSTRVALYGLIGLLCGNLSAYFLGFNRDLIHSGLFGYNAILVGLALATYDSPEKHSGYSWNAFIWTIIISSFSSIVFVSMGKLLVPHKSPPLTFPFNIATLMFLIATAEMARVQIGPVREPALPDYSTSGQDSGPLTARMFFAGVIRGMGQVFLADNIATGALVLAGIAVCSRIAAVAALVGSALGAAFAVATGVDSGLIENGTYGFNSSLSVTAMFMFYVPSVGAGILAVLASLLTVVAQQALAGLLSPYGLPFMTLPFCVISLSVIILQGTTSLVIAVPLATMTIPEDHLRRIQLLADGYQFLKDSIHHEREKSSKYGKEISKTLRHLSTTVSSESSKRTLRTSWWSLPSISFPSISCNKKSNVQNKKEWVEAAAWSIFAALDDSKKGTIDSQQFIQALKVSGLNEATGLRFAALVFDLVADTTGEESNRIDRHGFIAFAQVSHALLDIHRKVAEFVDFVNVDSNEFIGVEDLETAQEYLGQPPLTEKEQKELVVLNGTSGEDAAYFDVVELVNFVTVAYLQTLVSEYRSTSEHTESSSTL